MDSTYSQSEVNTFEPVKAARITSEQTGAYIDLLGLRPWRLGWLWRRNWIEFDGYHYDGRRKIKIVHRGWRAACYPVSPKTICSALRGSNGIDLREQSTVKFVVIDIDCHDFDGAPETEDVDAWLGETHHRIRRRFREHVAKHTKPIIEAIRRVTPGVEWQVLASPGGAHLLMLLEDPVSFEEANRIGRVILQRAGYPELEVFPKVEAGGRTARLPLTGGSRLLADDLVRYRHSRRVKDVEALLQTSCSSITSFEDPLVVSRSSKTMHKGGLSVRNNSKSNAEEKREGSTPPPPLDSEDACLLERLSRHLHGKEYRDTMIELTRRGIPDDGSYNAARKLSALMVYAGVTKADAIEAGRAFISRGDHRCDHAQTNAGQKQWISVFKSCLKHQERGVEAGRVRPGELRHPEVLEAIAELLGREPGKRRKIVMSDEVRSAKSRAAKTRWDRERVAAA